MEDFDSIQVLDSTASEQQTDDVDETKRANSYEVILHSSLQAISQSRARSGYVAV